MTGLIEQIVTVLGEAPNEEIETLYYILGCCMIIASTKYLFRLIFDYILGIKI